jgi:hypothetical protein
LKKNPDYEEAKLHWEQDLKEIGIDPEVIEAQVNTLNTDVDMFFASKVLELVRNAISTDEKLKAFEPKTGIPPLNHVSVNYVIKQLERDWIEDTGVDKRYDKDVRQYVLGGAIIATIEPQDETRLENIINSLRSKDNSITILKHSKNVGVLFGMM